MAYTAGQNSTSTGSIYQVSLQRTISSHYYPVILKGRELSPLLRQSLNQFALFADRGEGISPIPFQIDPRNEKGRFIFPDGDTGIGDNGNHETASQLDENDELALMSQDLGKQITNPAAAMAGYSSYGIESITEIAITDPTSGKRGWIYVVTSPNAEQLHSTKDYVRYDSLNDTIQTHSYHLGFSAAHPFLLDRMQWKDPASGAWSVDFADTMKVRHNGKLFQQFDFIRTQEDYDSTLVAVKDGPVRVIRKTDNRVRILWFIRTPAIEIDFVAYADSFVVDTLIHMRFTISDFFSDATTLFTMDWNENTPPIKIYSPSITEGVVIDGKTQVAEQRFGKNGDTEMIIANPYGMMLVALDLEQDIPLQPYLYLVDDKETLDPPENNPGQFGNAGFLTTGWEYLDTELHHIIFRVYMAQDITVEEGFRVLQQAPSSWD